MNGSSSNCKTTSEIDAIDMQEVAQVESWFQSERFSGIKRPYSATDVVKMRGTLLPHHTYQYGIDKKLYKLFKDCWNNKSYSATFGALDPVQVVQMAKYVSTVYVSGWQSSSTASTSNEPGPDIADYPYDTLPVLYFMNAAS